MASPLTFAVRCCPIAVVLCFVSAAWSGLEAEPLERGPKVEKYWVFIGTYTGEKSKGIYRFEMDAATGKLTGKELVAETANPTFLAIHPNQRFLYAVNEIANFKD